MKKENAKNNPKKRPTYTVWQNIYYITKQTWAADKLLLFSTIAHMPVTVLLPLAGAYLSKYVVMLVTENAAVSTLVCYILLLSGIILGLQLFLHFARTRIDWRSFGNRFRYMDLCCQKVMDMDYANYENPAGQTKMQKAFNMLYNNDGGTQQVFTQLVNMIANAAGLATYSVFIFTLSPWLVFVLVGITMADYFVSKRYNSWLHQNKDNWVPVERKLEYIKRKAGDFEAAKDVRLFGMSGWFNNAFALFLSERKNWHKKSERRAFLAGLFSAVMTFLRDATAYGTLIFAVINGHMSAADFVFYFSVITQYSNWLLGFITAYNALVKISLDFCDLREFLSIPDYFNRKKGVKLPAGAPEIVFDHVSFAYPNSEQETLKQVCFTIKKGEKVALVGLNGAGKTTLIKLLCGLYMPTSGKITVAGRSIYEYNRDEYYTLLSAVFQDICLLPVSVAKNIALCEEPHIQKQRLERALRLSGLSDKVKALPQKENTLLLKSIYEDATDFSGGEKQKLVLARALYKGGSVIILDEPTAALDPIAENEIYQKYNELTQGATSIFISHRLSSTRFCDRILYLEKGEITEEGNHDELMEKNGQYAKIFEMQSRYYKEAVQ